jgi:hypothetical protein
VIGAESAHDRERVLDLGAHELAGDAESVVVALRRLVLLLETETRLEE